ncbi:MAG: diphthamide biosynthesis enzyme Dph2 [Candidatus Methanoliparum thermophilum]|uniref:2-(3-amino-3-carboxypropyl)histidine synthase n=1 Tax=Methanoliparum thermophilum TaxID=2491083 RepID=A0A520KQV3_METT2|nr:MAG: diphthamide biosynthesis enzyme Dph2 [Candidatus Methanoliparum thermophilum]
MDDTYVVDLEELFALIDRKKAKIVGLQFPDGLVRFFQDIKEKLEDKRDILVLLSGNSSFGSCDIDFDLLNIVDLLFHFGHTSMFKIDKVEYIPVKIKLREDILEDLLKKSLSYIISNKISLVTTPQYKDYLLNIRDFYEENGITCSINEGDNRVKDRGIVLGCNFSAAKGAGKEVIFLGDGSFHPIGIKIATQKRVIRIDPLIQDIEEIRVEKLLKQRYALISKSIGFKSAGILVSNKIGQNRFDLAQRLYKETLNRGYKAYLIYMNLIRPESIGLKVDILVNTACPRIAIDDYISFDKPILTPIEFNMILKDKIMEYRMDEIREEDIYPTF